MADNRGVPVQSDVTFFKENGYWISPNIIGEDRLELLKMHMERVYNEIYETGNPPESGWNYRTGDPKRLRKTNNTHFADFVIRDLAWDPLIGEIATALLETECVRFWSDQLLHKPANAADHDPANVGWHQDFGYWQCFAEPSLLTAWVAFDDVDLDNGCMQVVPRSHLWGMLNVSNFFEQDLQKQQREIKLPEGETFCPVPLVMKAGQVSFHHNFTLHGSGRNVSDRLRRSLAIHMMAGETRYRAGTKFDKYTLIQQFVKQGGRDGDIAEGPMFPVMFRKQD